ncbi:PH domain-containing protein [Streptomyces sp. enrichment culture]|uniref:PH domain-containing protein n=1 Tax=Streptomyces sp. enrichment culture TaxID=1795815 RepID=UPI003F54826A
METGSPRAAETVGADRTEPIDLAVPPERVDRADRAPAVDRDGPGWTGLPRGLLRLRRMLLALGAGAPAIGTALPLGLLVGPAWAALALVPVAVLAVGWVLLEHNWRSWRYAERADELLISRGVLWRRVTVVPYGRMQLVEVTSGPVERRFGLASVQLHTAAAATDATIPGLDPAEAERLRDRLTALGEARSAGL